MFLKISQNWQEINCVGVFFNKVAGRPATTLKRDSNTGVLLSILRNFQKQLFYRTPLVAASGSGNLSVRPDLKICWLAVTRVCCFEYTWLVGKFFFDFEMEKIALILPYLTLFSSSLLRSIFCFYFFCNIHATIINLA